MEGRQGEGRCISEVMNDNGMDQRKLGNGILLLGWSNIQSHPCSSNKERISCGQKVVFDIETDVYVGPILDRETLTPSIPTVVIIQGLRLVFIILTSS